MSASARQRAWPFVINNPTDDDSAKLQNIANRVTEGTGKLTYLAFAPEVGDNGTPHFQGYLYNEDAITLTAVKKLLPRAHFVSPVKGTHTENRTYIFGPYDKDGKHKDPNPEAVEYGVLPKQGARNDLASMVVMLQEGARMKDIIPLATSIQSIRSAEILLKYIDPPRHHMTELYWYYGPTGCSKSHTAAEEAGSDPYYPLSAKWWDGYDRNDIVIFEDPRRDYFDSVGGFSWFLRLIDKYPMRLEAKGSSRQFVAKRVYVTTPHSPEAFWGINGGEDFAQMRRRLTVVKEFNVPYVANTN